MSGGCTSSCPPCPPPAPPSIPTASTYFPAPIVSERQKRNADTAFNAPSDMECSKASDDDLDKMIIMHIQAYHTRRTVWTGKDPQQPKPGDGNYFQQARLCAETGVDGDEEGQNQGADHAHPLPGGSLHYTLPSGLLDIAIYTTRIA
ncbi:hypothetical protein ZWY2020_004594 [Hordeum vulgare]|nr:hypothetical protein ZWY2020_004594 [Hordeum vulgare]